MNTTLSSLLAELERQRTSVMQLVKTTAADTLNRIPSPGKWSVMQILAHVVTAEKLSVAYLNKKVLGIEQVNDTGLMEDLKIGLLKISQRLPMKFKAPGRVVESTPVYSSLNELTHDWDAVRAQLAEILERFPDNRLRRKIYKHPFAGMLNIQQMLIFLREHITHHTPQIKRALR